SEVVIATDDERIAESGESFGATVCMTGDQHRSGTERIAEVADLLDWADDDIVVNLQGDEPAMPPSSLNLCAGLLDDLTVDVSTLASPLASIDDFEDSNVVKVLVNNESDAIYFSRAAIPFPRDRNAKSAMESALHHHGLYGYRCGILRQLVSAEPSPLELSEHLEQLRALALGMRIRVGIPDEKPGRGVDTEDDLEAVAKELAATPGRN
ncbi:MAG: 3-deoxy-manno-octulosonate cytidylyltransferase, partial [Woeseiaceae bacterium]